MPTSISTTGWICDVHGRRVGIYLPEARYGNHPQHRRRLYRRSTHARRRGTPWNRFLLQGLTTDNRKLTQFTLRCLTELRQRAALEHATIRGLYQAALAIEPTNDYMEPLRATLAASVK